LPLTRLVYHQRYVNLNENSFPFEEEKNLPNLSLLPEDITSEKELATISLFPDALNVFRVRR
jgi:hypothetical protein